MQLRVTALRRRVAALTVAAVAGPGLAICAALPAHASIPSHPAWESSGAFGIWTTGKFDIYNNEWNTSEAGPQTIWAYSHRHWGVESTQTDTTSVKTYPSVQQNYNNPRVTSLSQLHSTFQQSMPSAKDFDAEAAYDLWLNKFSIEVMMWVDNHGQRPAGHVIRHVTFYGQKFSLWQAGNNLYSFKLIGKHETKGTVHLLTMLDWLIKQHYLSSTVTLRQVNFGWEICSTDGKPMDFTVTNYSLATKR